MPRFSVVIPAFNAERSVAATIRSVLAQTEKDLELIVVDDGSSDRTPEVVAELQADPRVSLVHQDNQGTAAARNTGIARARAAYVSFLDNDDLWMPTYLAEMGAALDRRPDAGFAYCDAWGLDDATGRVHGFSELERYRPAPPESATHERLLVALVSENFVMSSTTVRREALDQVSGFDPTVRGTDDYDLWLRIALQGWAAVRGGSDPLLLQRGRSDSQSKDLRMMDDGMRTMLERVADDERMPAEGREIARRRIAEIDAEWRLEDRPNPVRRARRGLRLRLIAIRDRVRYDHYWPAEPPASVAAAFPNLRSGRPDRGSRS